MYYISFKSRLSDLSIMGLNFFISLLSFLLLPLLLLLHMFIFYFFSLVFQTFTICFPLDSSHLSVLNSHIHLLLVHCLTVGTTKLLVLAAPTVQLMFSSHQSKSTAEKLRGHILEAFETVLGSPVTIEIRCESKQDSGSGVHVPPMLPASKDNSFQAKLLQSDNLEMGRSEIVEVAVSPREPKGNEHIDNSAVSDKRGLGGSWVGEASASSKRSSLASLPERRKLGERSQSQSLVRSKVSLAHVIQQAEGCTQRNAWSKRKAVSIAEKLEQENLYVIRFHCSSRDWFLFYSHFALNSIHISYLVYYRVEDADK